MMYEYPDAAQVEWWTPNVAHIANSFELQLYILHTASVAVSFLVFCTLIVFNFNFSMPVSVTAIVRKSIEKWNKHEPQLNMNVLQYILLWFRMSFALLSHVYNRTC